MPLKATRGTLSRSGTRVTAGRCGQRRVGPCRQHLSRSWAASHTLLLPLLLSVNRTPPRTEPDSCHLDAKHPPGALRGGLGTSVWGHGASVQTELAQRGVPGCPCL